MQSVQAGDGLLSADGIPGSRLQCLASVFTTLDQTRPDLTTVIHHKMICWSAGLEPRWGGAVSDQRKEVLLPVESGPAHHSLPV